MSEQLPDRCECEGWIGRWAYHGRNDQPDTFRCSDCDRILADTSAADRRPADQGDRLDVLAHCTICRKDHDPGVHCLVPVVESANKALAAVRAEAESLHQQLRGAVDALWAIIDSDGDPQALKDIAREAVSGVDPSTTRGRYEAPAASDEERPT